MAQYYGHSAQMHLGKPRNVINSTLGLIGIKQDRGLIFYCEDTYTYQKSDLWQTRALSKVVPAISRIATFAHKITSPTANFGDIQDNLMSAAFRPKYCFHWKKGYVRTSHMLLA